MIKSLAVKRCALIFLFSLFLVAFLLVATNLLAQNTPIPGIDLRVGESNSPQQVANTLQIIALLTVLSLAPAILLMTTSFTRFIIVLSLLRNALGTQQSPPNQVLVGLSLFLTFFVMAPVWSEVNNNALQPYLDSQITQVEALQATSGPLKDFMIKFTRDKDLALFMRLANLENPNSVDDVPLWVLIPAFLISELKTAFQIGFIIYVPFIVIDMVVASILLAMGMMMLPPSLISLPLKLMLFVLADGWNLTVGSLTEAFFK